MKTTGKSGKKKTAGKKPAVPSSPDDDKRLEYENRQLRPGGRSGSGYKTK